MDCDEHFIGNQQSIEPQKKAQRTIQHDIINNIAVVTVVIILKVWKSQGQRCGSCRKVVLSWNFKQKRGEGYGGFVLHTHEPGRDKETARTSAQSGCKRRRQGGGGRGEPGAREEAHIERGD